MTKSKPNSFLKKFLLIILIALTGLPAIAQNSKPSGVLNAAAGGFSAERLQRLDKSMDEWVQKGWINGSVALIMRKGKIIYYKASGYNNLASKTPLEKDAIFRIASQTKAITSVAVMMLFEEGKLLLTDPVSKFLPAFKSQQVLVKFNAADSTYTTVPSNREVTVKDLLTHTSGIGYAQIGSKESNAIYAKSNITAGIGVTNGTLLEAMNRLGKQPLMHQPGQKFTYGLNTDLLGCLVEQISGMTLNDFFRKQIFEPLKMKDTYFQIPAEKAGRLVNMYSEDAKGQLVLVNTDLWKGPTTANFPLLKTTYYSGGAGLSAPIQDYAIFLQMLLNGGELNGKRLLSRNTVRMMTMNQIGDLNLGDDKFGLGFQVETEKGSAGTPAQVGTYSWGGAFSTSYWVDPKENMVMLFYRQLQNSTHGDVVEKFRALAYQAIVD